MNSPDIRSEFSYDQFVNLSHSECVELMMKPGGPYKYPYEKTKQQYSYEKSICRETYYLSIIIFLYYCNGYSRRRR